MNMMAVVCCGGGPRLWVIANQRYLIGGACVHAHAHTHAHTHCSWLDGKACEKEFRTRCDTKTPMKQILMKVF